DRGSVVGACNRDGGLLAGPAAVAVVHLHGKKVVELLARRQRIHRPAIAHRVMPGAVLIDAGAAVAGRTAQREAVRVARIDVAEGDLPGRGLARRRQIIAFRHRPGLRRRGDHRGIVGAGDGDGRALRHRAAVAVNDVVVDRHGGVLANRQMVVGVGVDRYVFAVERPPGGEAGPAVGLYMPDVAAVGVGGAGVEVDGEGRAVRRGPRVGRRGDRRVVVGAGDGDGRALRHRAAV